MTQRATTHGSAPAGGDVSPRMTRPHHVGKALSGDAAVSKTAERGSIPRADANPQGRLSVTLPWPPAELSPNFRTRSRTLVAVRRKQYRAECAKAAWLHGINPARRLTVERIVFHPPDARARDDDNLIARFKAGRDGLADAMGVDDASFNGVPVEVGAPVKGGAVVVLLTEIPG